MRNSHITARYCTFLFAQRTFFVLRPMQVSGLKKEESLVRGLVSERADLLTRATLPDAAGGTDKRRGRAAAALKAQLPLMAEHPTSVLGAVSEAFGDALLAFIDSNPDGVLHRMNPDGQDDAAGGGKKKKGSRKKGGEAEDVEVRDAGKRRPGMRPEVEADTFLRLMQVGADEAVLAR